ncbi:HNH endonuclease signature motif containing protein [Clostridium sp. D53t1_180928_C8]|uniref:HNH endonuclease n=1 Tax=Clostridium sp. D53t1_180928_C8 TaxID=2787101 RepID=UPI0018AC2077|nr:HNH endonuclease signature motif containing protein [Clostridium sp. D53t1_180928_C8]
MGLVENSEEIFKNINKLREYLTNNFSNEFKKLISKGKCFIVISNGSECEFYPSKFIGYRDNSLEEYFQTSVERDGRDSNRVIAKILGFRNFEESTKIDEKYIIFCEKHDIKVCNFKRKYYVLEGKYIENNEANNIRINNESEFINRQKVLKEEFIEYMRKTHKEYNITTIKTFFTDAKYLINNNLGYDFYSILLDEKFIDFEYANVLTKYFSNKKYQESARSHSTGYVRAIKYLREFMIYKKYIISEKEEIEEVNNFTCKLDNTEREQVVKTRVGQGIFKAKLINRESKCIICGMKIKELLIASHCKPWCKSNNYERVDINNGLLLCPNHDALFDKGLITFNDKGEIIISKIIPIEEYELLNINKNISIKISKESIKYISWHRINAFIDK